MIIANELSVTIHAVPGTNPNHGSIKVRKASLLYPIRLK